MIALLLAPLLLARTASAAPSELALSYRDAPVLDLVRDVAEATGRNLILSDTGALSDATVTIVTQAPVPPEQAWQAVLLTLDGQGWTAVEESGFTRIVPATDPARLPLPVVR